MASLIVLLGSMSLIGVMCINQVTTGVKNCFYVGRSRNVPSGLVHVNSESNCIRSSICDISLVSGLFCSRETTVCFVFLLLFSCTIIAIGQSTTWGE